jgi:hypothetical protein
MQKELDSIGANVRIGASRENFLECSQITNQNNNFASFGAVHNETGNFKDPNVAEARPLGRAESVLGRHTSACCGA